MTTEPNDAFRRYRKKNTQIMRPYREGENMDGVSITEGVEPEVGGMIALSETNLNDIWYITPEFFNANYEEV